MSEWFTKKISRLSITMLLLFIAFSTPAWADPFLDGLGYISASQDPTTGTWGAAGGTSMRDSTVVLELLTLASRRGSTFHKGVDGIADLIVLNNDALARQSAILQSANQNITLQLDVLLASQNPEIFDPSQRDFPGRGWGIAPGFGNSTLDTALALRGLQAGGFPGVISVVGENLDVSETGPAHPFTVPQGATNLLLRVQQVTGGTVLFIVQLPDQSSLSVPIPPGGPFDIGGLPLNAGEWNLRAENQSGSPVSYTAEVAFTDTDGFDHFRITSALSYLGLAQNPDGGWGLAPGEDSHLMVTTEVIRALAGAGGTFGPNQNLSAAASWLVTLQNPDGGFSSVPGQSNTNETAMAAVAISLATTSASLESAVNYLLGVQLPNGSWGDDPYLTAIAMEVLQAAGQGITPLILKSGFEG